MAPSALHCCTYTTGKLLPVPLAEESLQHTACTTREPHNPVAWTFNRRGTIVSFPKGCCDVKLQAFVVLSLWPRSPGDSKGAEGNTWTTPGTTHLGRQDEQISSTPANPFLRSSAARVSREGAGLANIPRGSRRLPSSSRGTSAVRFRRLSP